MTPEIKQRIEQIHRGEVPEGYKCVKDSIIPSDWKQYCLGELGKNKNGLNFHREDKGSKIRILGVGDFGNLSVLREVNALSEISLAFTPEDALLLKNGDIVFVRSNGSKELVGRNLLVYPQNEKVTFSGFCIRFRLCSNEITTAEYINLILDKGALKRKLQSENQGSNISNLNQSIIDDLQISMPCKDEQKKIAEILTAQDKVIELKEKLLNEKQRQKKYLMQQLLTGKKRLPGFSEMWEKKKLGELIFEISNRNKKKLIMNVLSVSNRFGFISQSEQFGKYVASDDTTNYKIVSKGDIAYNPSRINVGSIALYEKEEQGIVSPMYVVLHTKEELSKEYFMQYLGTNEFLQKMKSVLSGSVRESLNFSDLCHITLRIPSIDEQTAIAEILSTADREIELLQKDIEQEKQKKKALMQLLLTGIVRV